MLYCIANQPMPLDKSQIVPFPLPEHLCLFISERLNTPIEVIGNGVQAKSLHISAYRPTGKFILKCLKQSQKPNFNLQGVTMYISTSKYISTNHDNFIECRGTFLEIPEQTILEITEIFEDLFRICLVAFIDGSNFGASYKKGHRKYALTTFLNKYNVAGDDLMFDKYQKHYQREKNRGKTLVFS